MTRYKPGSRIATVYAAFESGGEAAALAAGQPLGLAAGTLRSWIRVWGREASGEAPAKAGSRAPGELKAGTIAPKGNIKVVWTARPARLIEEGPQQSEIKWLDTGSTQCLPNDQWIKIKKD
jgi:hypothetical protein